MAKKIKAESSSESLEDLDLDETLPPIEEEAKFASSKNSTVNLDEYGIWVKAEPEDFKADDSFDENEMALEDLSPEETGEGGTMQAEGGLIDDLDIPEEESLPGLEASAEESSFMLEEEPVEISVEEPVGESDEAEIMEPIAESDEAEIMEPVAESGIEETPALEEEAALEEDFGSLEEEVPAVEETVVRDETESSPLEELAPEAMSLEEPGRESPGGGGDFEEVSLDDLGIEISAAAPAEETLKKSAKSHEPAPAHAAVEAMPHVIDDEFASLSLELEEEDGTRESAEEKGSLELDELELPEEEEQESALALEPVEEGAPAEEALEDLTGPETLEEIPELELGAEETVELETGEGEAAEEIEVPLSEEVAIAESDEDLGNLEPELDDVAAAAPSSSTLKNIEAELRSIKAELTQLKSELGVLRGKKASGKTGDRNTGAAGAGGDFFEEEEDETIALTGEELDNIMTTADIKEEAKAEIAEPATEEVELELGEDIIGYEETAAPEEPSPQSAEEEVEEIGFDAFEGEAPAGEVKPDLESAAGAGEIEIEIPELESGPEEIVPETAMEEMEPIEDLSATEGGLELESADVTPLEGALEEAEELQLETEPVGKAAPGAAPASSDMELPSGLKEEIKSVLGYMDQLLESLPEEKIEEFAKSEYFSIYKKLFEELGLVS
ncbi:MAG: hypothetical protein JXD23_12895 [Spirochaetales bacterium]|nr:hypothetical protein [Spirochaetales bacterium]